MTEKMTAHKRDLLGKWISQEQWTLISGVPLTVENTKTTIIMRHSEDGYFKGELMEIQHKIFISSFHRNLVCHVFPPCSHRKIQFQTVILQANDRVGKKSREQTRWSTNGAHNCHLIRATCSNNVCCFTCAGKSG